MNSSLFSIELIRVHLLVYIPHTIGDMDKYCSTYIYYIIYHHLDMMKWKLAPYDQYLIILKAP